MALLDYGAESKQTKTMSLTVDNQEREFIVITQQLSDGKYLEARVIPPL